MLHSYQISAASFLLQHPRSALFADPGTGKTLIILTVLDCLKALDPGLKTLVVAPLRVCEYVWPAEIEKWGFDFSCQYLSGKNQAKCDIDLVNPESLKRIEQEYDILIIDESSKFKNPSAKRFKQLRPLLPKIERIHILTGTPAPQSLMDLWAQFYLVDQGRALGAKITHFRNRFFYPISRGAWHDWRLRNRAEEEIKRIIAPITYRIDASTALDMPDLIENEITVEMPVSVRKIYSGMARKLHAVLESGDLTAPTAASAYLACRQMSGGAVYREDHSVEDLHNAKLEALDDLAQELQGKPLLVGYCFRHEGDRLLKKFPGCAILDGRTSGKDTARVLQRWNAGALPMLCAQNQTISHGLNLQSGGCRDVCWFSLTDDFDSQDQFVRRVYRQGVAGSVRVHYLIARNTVDQFILARSRDKNARQKSLLEYLASNKHAIIS